MSEDKNQRARKLANRYAAALFATSGALFSCAAWMVAPWLGVLAAALSLFLLACLFACVSAELSKGDQK